MSQDVASGGVRLEANTNREHLPAIIEQKLDQNTSEQAEASKGLRGDRSRAPRPAQPRSARSQLLRQLAYQTKPVVRISHVAIITKTSRRTHSLGGAVVRASTPHPEVG